MRLQIAEPRDQLILSTFRLTAQNAGGSIWSGSGFVARNHIGGKGSEYFLVTNRHLVSTAIAVECQMAKYAQSGPDYRFLSGRKDIDASPHPAKGWFCHPKADVAVFRLGPHERCNDPDDGTFKYAVISTSSFAPTATAISLGEDVLFVGYPDGLIDPASAAPIYRKGIVASPPSLNWQEAEAFLIDASVFPGSSGSPVYATNRGLVFNGNVLTLLGIVSSVMTYGAKGRLEAQRVPTAADLAIKFRNPLHLGVVVRASCIQETIDGVLAGTAISVPIEPAR